jgi:hypothetical protein
MPGPHDRIIAEAAKASLRPLGFQRKGRSRTWLADHGWWLTIVEFQPSAWSKGSYLNVAAHWLWSGVGVLSFDFGDRASEFVDYVSDDQFTPAAARLAEMAAQEAQRLAQTFTSAARRRTCSSMKCEASTRRATAHGWPTTPVSRQRSRDVETTRRRCSASFLEAQAGSRTCWAEWHDIWLGSPTNHLPFATRLPHLSPASEKHCGSRLRTAC